MKAARVPLGRLGWRRLVVPAVMCATGPRAYSALAPAVASGLERARVRRDDLLVVSVSGGADSVALLRLLLALNGDDAAEWRLDLHVLHFNHALRPEAAAEEEFVRALAAQHGLPVHVRRLEPGWADDGASGGVQGRSRAWRRAESLALLSSLGAADAADDDGARGAIALGHHADDQAETLLLKLLRGCHLSNVQGMEWRSGGFARPLLDVRKAELLDYLRAEGQEWMEDASNAEPKYKRNRVRLELLPLLDELAGSGGGLRARLAAAERQSAQLREWLEAESAARLDEDPAWAGAPPALSVSRLLAAPPPVQEELLHALVARGSGGACALPYALLCRARDQLDAPSNEWQLHVSADWALRRVGDRIALHAAPARPVEGNGGGEEEEESARLEIGGVALRAPAAWAVQACWADEAPPPAGAVVLHNVAAGAELELRPWRAGDRFHPSWKRAPIALKDFLRGQKLPLEERRALPLVCSGSDVLAVCAEKAHVGKPHAEGGGDARALWIVVQEAPGE